MAKWPGKPVRDGNMRLFCRVIYPTYQLTGQGSPFGMETYEALAQCKRIHPRQNGLGSPVGMETTTARKRGRWPSPANWPEEPGRDGNTAIVSSGREWESGEMAWESRSGWKLRSAI